MKNKHFVIIVIVLLLILGAVLFINKTRNDSDVQISGEVVKDIPKPEDSELDNDRNLGDKIGIGGSVEGSDRIEKESSSQEEFYMPDIENSPCGFYTNGYGICGGYCPEGTCTQDGEVSCYCKK